MFLLYDQKVKTKTKIRSERKEFLRWNLKTYFIIFKGLSLKQIKQIFLQGKCPALDLFFSTAIWLSHGQLWAILEGTASLTRC